MSPIDERRLVAAANAIAARAVTVALARTRLGDGG
jgi:hypothetical protein